MSESYQFQRPARPAPDPADQEPEYNPRARLDYLQSVNPHKKKRRWLRVVLMLLLLIVLAAAGAFAYPKIFKKDTSTTQSQHSSAKPQQTTKPVETKVATKHFDSTNFNLGFEYPADWTVTDNSETARLTVVSPPTSQKNSNGQTALIRTVVTIAAKGQNLSAFDRGSGLAVRNSEKIKYVSPTSAQRAETYLTFVQYSTTAAGDGLDGVYITGDYGYQKGQYIPKTDMAGLDPLIAVTFERCADSKCVSTPASATLPSDTWDDDSFTAPILTLLKSLSVN